MRVFATRISVACELNRATILLGPRQTMIDLIPTVMMAVVTENRFA